MLDYDHEIIHENFCSITLFHFAKILVSSTYIPTHRQIHITRLTLCAWVRFHISLTISGAALYNDARKYYGLPVRTSFSEISSNPLVAQRLAAAYANNISAVESYVGGLAEGALHARIYVNKTPLNNGTAILTLLRLPTLPLLERKCQKLCPFT